MTTWVGEHCGKSTDSEKSGGAMTEDDVESTKSDVQDLTKKYESQVGDLAKSKEVEVME